MRSRGPWLILVGCLACGLAVLGCYWPFGPSRAVLRLPGTVEVQEVRLGSKVGGRVAEVFIREGQQVVKDQELVRLEAPELEAQRDQWQARLAAAEAELRKARYGPRPQELDEARAALAAAEARLQRLRAGPREEEIRQARNESEASEADAQQAREDFSRATAMRRSSSISQADWDAARAANERSLGRARAARARLDLLLAGSRPEDIAEAEGERERLKAKYELLKAGTRVEDIDLAEAQAAEMRGRLKEIEANLRETVVRAPEPALIEVLAVRPGDLLTPNQPVARVLRTEDLWVKIYVPETDLGKVRLNDTCEVLLDSYPHRRFPGTVEYVASASEFTPRNVQSIDERRHQVFALKVRVPNPEGIFKSGLAAEVFLPLREAR